MVMSEIFCGETLQYSDKFYNEQTYVVHNIEKLPLGTKECLIRIWDGKNRLTRKVILPKIQL